MNSSFLIKAVNQAINEANSDTQFLSDYAVNLSGMTSVKIKTFLNRLNKRVNTYLEIGLYKGATFISAIEGNKHLSAVGCDNWSQFNGPKTVFFDNFYGRPSLGGVVNVYDMDCFSQEFKKAVFREQTDVLFYDGDHKADSQIKAVELFKDIMATSAVLIVDDWHKWGEKPTLQAIKNANLTIDASWTLAKQDGWWEGVGVFVLTK